MFNKKIFYVLLLIVVAVTSLYIGTITAPQILGKEITIETTKMMSETDKRVKIEKLYSKLLIIFTTVYDLHEGLWWDDINTVETEKLCEGLKRYWYMLPSQPKDEIATLCGELNVYEKYTIDTYASFIGEDNENVTLVDIVYAIPEELKAFQIHKRNINSSVIANTSDYILLFDNDCFFGYSIRVNDGSVYGRSCASETNKSLYLLVVQVSIPNGDRWQPESFEINWASANLFVQ